MVTQWSKVDAHLENCPIKWSAATKSDADNPTQADGLVLRCPYFTSATEMHCTLL